jgi:uncharacterized protein (DUF362 family)
LQLTRRELLAGAAAGATAGTGAWGKAAPPSATVAIARCRSYDRAALEQTMATMFRQIGGIGKLVRNQTVTVKLNLTGNPGRFPLQAEYPYRSHPDTVLALVHLLGRNGARRVRLIESFFPAGQDMALWARYGLDIAAIENAGPKVEWENTQNLGRAKKYVTHKVPGGGLMFPAYDLNHSFTDTDVYVSLSKLKNHWIAGVTMALKNNFGNTPCSLYGGDCGPSGNEQPTQERGQVCHSGKSGPPAGVAQELDAASPRDGGYRVPRIVVDLVAVRPIDLAVVDGIESIRGGEGVWNRGVQIIKPGVMLAGRNPVCVDTVSTAVMGHDPRAGRGAKPFLNGDNTLLLAEAAGIGTARLEEIEVAGLSIREALHDYGPGPVGHTI